MVRIRRAIRKPLETRGQRIRRLRLARGWTQWDLALEAGLNQARVSWAELDHDLYASALTGIARALDVSLDYLTDGEVEP